MVGRELIDVLERRGLKGLSGDVQARRREVIEGLKPKNFLTADEIGKVKEALEGLEIPSPKSMAEALLVHSRRKDVENFSASRSFCPVCLRNLSSTLLEAGLEDQAIFRKLEQAAERGERYGVKHCTYPDATEATDR